MESTEKLKKIFSLALAVNERTTTDVFVDLSPHVNNICLRIYPQGWVGGEYSPKYVMFDIYYDGDCVCVNKITLDEIAAALQSVLNDTFDVNDYTEEA